LTAPPKLLRLPPPLKRGGLRRGSDENVWPYLHWLLDTYNEITLHEMHVLRMGKRKIQDFELKELLESHKQTLRELSKAA
jgi:hypothetical protein